MNQIAIDNGYFMIIDNDIEGKKCVLELGKSIATDGLTKIVLDENDGYWRYFANDDTDPSKLLEKAQDQTFAEFIDVFINNIYNVIGIDKSLFFKRVNGELVEYYE